MSANSIFEAAAAGDVDFLKQKSSNLGEKNERGWTVLHFAARYGQIAVAKYVLERDSCELDAVNAEGKTAAQVAEFWGFDELAQLLGKAAEEPKSASESSPATVDPFPPNRTNFFAGSPLNRYGWYRSDSSRLQQLARQDNARYLVFNRLDPLFDNDGLHFLPYSRVSAIVDAALVEESQKKPVPEGDELIAVFLGIDDTTQIPYWAVDITPNKGIHQEQLEKLIKELESEGLEFSSALPRALSIDKPVAGILAQARAMVDWNIRNRFCPACGRKTISNEGGHKRTCPPLPDNGGAEEPCLSQKGVHNFAYPRTDPVIIVCIVHPSEDKILLGRQKRWPENMYSCIAGFVEAGESIEEAVRREALEEAGIVVDRVAYHSSQPWPFPNSLMLGFIAEAVSTDIKLEDKELEKAAWFTRAEILAALNGEPAAPLKLPPFPGAVGYKVIKTWATEKAWTSRNLKNAKM